MTTAAKRFSFVSLLITFLLVTPAIVSRQSQQSRPPASQQQQSDQSLTLSTQVVNIPAAVTDVRGRYVVGLEKENFEVYEDNVKQKIEFFSTMDAPVSVGIVFDISGSMAPKIDGARHALKKLIDASHADDDFFLITFASNPKLVQDFTNNGDSIANALAFVTPNGSTAVYDGAYMAVEKVRQGKYKRRAIIIISDGEDNSSRYSYNELKKLVTEADVQIYAIGIAGIESEGMRTLEQISQMTGGHAYATEAERPLRPLPGEVVDTKEEELRLEVAVNRIALELRHQYSLGYVSQNPNMDGKFRKIRVIVNPIKGMSKLSVRAREGYFAQKSLEVTDKTGH